MLFNPSRWNRPPAQTEEQRLLLGGADYIEKYGWIQNGFGDKERGFCLLGSMMAFSVEDRKGEPLNPLSGVGYDTLAVSAAETKVEETIKKKWPTFVGAVGVPLWNDSTNRTKEEVIATMRAAADAE